MPAVSLKDTLLSSPADICVPPRSIVAAARYNLLNRLVADPRSCVLSVSGIKSYPDDSVTVSLALVVNPNTALPVYPIDPVYPLGPCTVLADPVYPTDPAYPTDPVKPTPPSDHPVTVPSDLNTCPGVVDAFICSGSIFCVFCSVIQKPNPLLFIQYMDWD